MFYERVLKFTFLYQIILSDSGESAILRDILLYASHPDPQLKGNCSLIIGNLVSAVLTEGRGNFDKWVKQNSQSSS